MSTVIHFIDVGQGNMALVECSDGTNSVVDCNITEGNKDRILDYIASQIGSGSELRAFICTHRDADHMRGVRILHDSFPLQEIWDSGYPGTTTDSSEYEAYMRLRRKVGSKVIGKQKRWDFGNTRLRCLSAKDDRLSSNANAQGIVLKVEQRTSVKSTVEGSTILSGDCDAETWKYGILKDYRSTEVSCDILLGGHHGSITFFEDPDDDEKYYVGHMKAMSPAMSIISVGENSYGHPDEDALNLYEKYSSGSNKGNKVYRTDQQGTMKLTLKSGGGWSLSINQGS